MKKFLATGAMLAYITWFNSTGASAAMLPEITANDIQGPKHHQSARSHKKDSGAKKARLAQKLGVDPKALQLDLAAGLSVKDVLKKYGITRNQFRELAHK
jgi:hypothetical protein